jgi:hypothetical protein
LPPLIGITLKLAAATLLALLASPAVAHAEPASIVSHDLPLGAARSLAAAQETPPFTLVGLHWRGAGAVRFRTRSLEGRWSAWLRAAPEDEDSPDRRGPERSRPGWRLGNPYWTGPSNRIEYRVSGKVQSLRGHFVWSAAEREPTRTTALAGAPAVIPRLSWGANELLKRAPPSFASSTQFAIVHHTAGTNNYSRSQSAAIVKGIQLYHVQGNGWNDIGYNFLVDKYGQVFEGRFGGMERNVVGAHAQGFNTGSVGVAVIGHYNAATLPPAARRALVQLLSWRLDVAHVDPLSTFNWLSGGNSRFPAGIPLFLRAIVGHRDTGFTDCPGDSLYAQLDDLAGEVASTGLPKLFAPVVRGSVGGPVRFTARLSSPLPWTVTVSDAFGTSMATGTGFGSNLSWTWESAAAPPGTYSWTIGAGPAVRPATGTIGARPTGLTLTRVYADPVAVTPNGDGLDDSTTIRYTLGAAATVTAALSDAGGIPLGTLFSEPKPAGQHFFQFTAESLADGTYQVTLTALGPSGKVVTAVTSVLVNRNLSAFAAGRRAFSPNGDGRFDSLPFTFTLVAPSQVKLRILRDGKWVATPFSGSLAPGPQALSWDGRKRIGRVLDGAYDGQLTVTDVAGTVSQKVSFLADSTRPVVLLRSTRPLRLHVSEPAEVVIMAGGSREVVKRTRAGAFTVRPAPVAGRVRIVAWDAAGNASRPVRYR